MHLRKSKAFLATAVALLIGLGTYAATSTYSYSLKHHPRPRKGCYPVENISVEEAKELLASQNLTVKGATDKEIRTLGAGVYWVQYLNDGVLQTGTYRGKNRYPFIINNSNGAGQRVDHIKIGRSGKKNFGLSVAQHIHEWAHLIGNNGAYQTYRDHLNKTGEGYCSVSGYSNSKFNEQFAEVFTAFVTEPKILLDNASTPKACRAVYEFFENWFNAGNRALDCQH
jgi:hypothetical protein